MEIYSSTVLEARGLKSSVSRVMPSEGSRRESVPVVLLVFGVAGNHWHSLAGRHITQSHSIVT